jgi:sugar phosphate isomerase/epimerase
MPSRREFLGTASMILVGSALRPAAADGARHAIKSALNGPIGLQLWSLREYLPKDLPGTLQKIKDMGFREVEGAGLWKHTAADLRAALEAAELRCQSAHMNYERLRDDLPGAFAEAKALGATWVVCPWIPHDKSVTREDTLRAAALFNRAAKTAHDRGMRFSYHCHGYEFVPSTEGTLFDTLAGATNPKQVEFQIDVFHALFGGADPAKLIEQHAARVTSLHLKDLKKGVPLKPGTSIGTPHIDVPVGTGQVDMSAVLAAAKKAGTLLYYIEDESADPLSHIPKSLDYLEAFTYATTR